MEEQQLVGSLTLPEGGASITLATHHEHMITLRSFELLFGSQVTLIWMTGSRRSVGHDDGRSARLDA
jgi:hypothetical protein